jgi:hypothetical protein
VPSSLRPHATHPVEPKACGRRRQAEKFQRWLRDVLWRSQARPLSSSLAPRHDLPAGLLIVIFSGEARVITSQAFSDIATLDTRRRGLRDRVAFDNRARRFAKPARPVYRQPALSRQVVAPVLLSVKVGNRLYKRTASLDLSRQHQGNRIDSSSAQHLVYSANACVATACQL